MRVSSLLTVLGAVGAYAADPLKVPIDPKVYDDISYYAQYAPASSIVPCAVPPHGSVVDAYIDINITDTQATLFRNDARQEYIFVYPGTASLQDLLTDFTFVPVPYMPLTNKECKACAVHAGFFFSWKSAAEEADQKLEAAFNAHPSYTLVVMGHSLGGALAQLAYASLAPTNKYHITGVYTYGQPRVGNQQFADYIDTLAGASETATGIFHRTTHTNDGVPQLPPTTFGFRHSRTEFWELDNNATGHPSVETTFRCFGQEPADCNDSAGGVGINAAHGSYGGFAGVNCQ